MNITQKILYVMLFSLLFSACSKTEEVEMLALPPTPVLQNRPQWILVTSSHARLYAKAAKDSDVLDTAWRMTVLRILSQSPGDIDGYHWYRVSQNSIQGWVSGSRVDLFFTRHEAERASQSHE